MDQGGDDPMTEYAGRHRRWIGVAVALLFPGTVVSAAQAIDVEAEVRETAEFLCSNQGQVEESDLYVAKSDGSGGQKLSLRTYRGNIVDLVLSASQWDEARRLLREIANYDDQDPAACLDDLMERLLPGEPESEDAGGGGEDNPDQITPVPAEPESRRKSFTFSERNGHCASDREFALTVRASVGWYIDTNSIDNSGVRYSSRSTFLGAPDPTPEQFIVRGRVINSGSCGPFWRDGRGHIWGTVFYNEIRDESGQ